MEKWKRWVATAGLVALAWPAAAQEKRQQIVVDGEAWMSATPVERRAFLVGAGNMLIAERSYAMKRNLPPAPVGEEITKAVDRMTLADIEARITRWYEMNPDRRSMPVMGVLWRDIVRGQR
jgi:hypothetical protein